MEGKDYVFQKVYTYEDMAFILESETADLP
jgi:hypothetical protein